MANYSREQLLSICERAFIAEDKWRNRDSAQAHRQLGECYALLRAGCEFSIRTKISDPGDSCVTSDNTIWVAMIFKGFQAFEYGDHCMETETFYLPTEERLNKRGPGEDWY